MTHSAPVTSHRVPRGRSTLTVLSENAAGFGGLLAEWGLSIWLEVEGRAVLFDTGQSVSAVHNARRLEVDLAAAERIVLSHGHFDHTGGLPAVLEAAGGKPVVGHPGIFERRRSRSADGFARDIGITRTRAELEADGARFELSCEPVEVLPGVVTSGEIPCPVEEASTHGRLERIRDGRVEPDPVDDDLALGISTERGLVAVLGCAHSGVLRTVRRLLDVTGQRRVHAVIGGTHLVHASSREIDKVIDELEQLGVQRLACSHCTGPRAELAMMNRWQKSYLFAHAGMRMTV